MRTKTHHSTSVAEQIVNAQQLFCQKQKKQTLQMLSRRLQTNTYLQKIFDHFAAQSTMNSEVHKHYSQSHNYQISGLSKNSKCENRDIGCFEDYQSKPQSINLNKWFCFCNSFDLHDLLKRSIHFNSLHYGPRLKADRYLIKMFHQISNYRSFILFGQFVEGICKIMGWYMNDQLEKSPKKENHNSQNRIIDQQKAGQIFIKEVEQNLLRIGSWESFCFRAKQINMKIDKKKFSERKSNKENQKQYLQSVNENEADSGVKRSGSIMQRSQSTNKTGQKGEADEFKTEAHTGRLRSDVLEELEKYKEKKGMKKSTAQLLKKKRNFPHSASREQGLRKRPQKVKQFDQLVQQCPYQMSRILKLARKESEQRAGGGHFKSKVLSERSRPSAILAPHLQHSPALLNSASAPNPSGYARQYHQRRRLSSSSSKSFLKNELSYQLLNQKQYLQNAPLKPPTNKPETTQRKELSYSEHPQPENTSTLPKQSEVGFKDEDIVKIVELQSNLECQSDPVLNRLLEQENRTEVTKYSVEERVYLESNAARLSQFKNACHRRLHLKVS